MTGMRSSKRIFYVGMIATDLYAQAKCVKTYSGAAAVKMIAVARALRAHGYKACVVSIPSVDSQANDRFYSAIMLRHRNVPVVFIPTFRSRYWRKLFSPILLAGFALRSIRKSDTVLLYNHAIEYVPLIGVLLLRGVKIVQDVEDAPLPNAGGLRGLYDRVMFSITMRFTERRKMVVAEHVAQHLKLTEYEVIRGVAPSGRAIRMANKEKWEELRRGGELRVHYGGTLVENTGIDLFCETVKRLVDAEGSLGRRVLFVVTGIGELDKIRSLELVTRGSQRVRIELLPSLTAREYADVLSGCHSSLSLKRPSSSLADTTFPSKVIEILSAGLALVATPMGDVATLFNEGRAFLLSDYTSKSLAETILRMSKDPGLVETTAETGCDYCVRSFSEEAVGAAMARVV